jgi:hypothetical protein
MNIINKFIERIISEAALDSRVENGMLNLKNADHLQVVAEALYDACEDETVVNEFVDKFMEEGKYPDRQAFNKEGWLVTFPSKQYRDAAIKKGSHSISDPTHGKGGMNLYYKKKGKQKRQKQQATTQVQPDQPSVKATKPQEPTATPASDAPKASMDQKRADRLAQITGQKPSAQSTSTTDKPVTSPKAAATKVSSPETPEEPAASAPSDAPSSGDERTPAEMPAIDVPVATTPPEEYAAVSKKFARQKGWMSEPYGEYRDAEGNTVAVVGLSGEVVPVRSNDREEYKLFAEKNMP